MPDYHRRAGRAFVLTGQGVDDGSTPNSKVFRRGRRRSSLRPLSYWDDMERQNELVIVTGQPILRFATVAIRLFPEAVESQLQAAHARFGRA